MKHLPLQPAVEGARLRLDKHAGPLSYYVDGDGEPLLLIHSINAAASACEMRPIYDQQRRQRRVYAVDLPGFGFSDRSRRDYCVDLYVAAIDDMLDLIAVDCPGAQVDAAALSLSGEFLSRAVAQRPGSVRAMVLINPTGFNARALQSDPLATGPREVPGMLKTLSLPVLSPLLFGLLTRRGSINYFLSRTWGSKQIDKELAEYCYWTSHQPGARYAPLAFLSGRLFSRDIVRLYRQLELPIWVPHGTRGDFRDFSGADWARQTDHWRFEAFDSGALPHFEQPQRFFAELDQFLNAAGHA